MRPWGAGIQAEKIAPSLLNGNKYKPALEEWLLVLANTFSLLLTRQILLRARLLALHSTHELKAYKCMVLSS